MKTNADHSLAAEMRAAKTDHDRRCTLAKYAIEAGKGNLSAVNVNKIENIQKEKELSARKYRSQVVDILKDEKLADMLLKDCPTDVPKNKEAADAGYLLYYWTEESTEKA